MRASPLSRFAASEFAGSRAQQLLAGIIGCFDEVISAPPVARDFWRFGVSVPIPFCSGGAAEDFFLTIFVSTEVFHFELRGLMPNTALEPTATAPCVSTLI